MEFYYVTTTWKAAALMQRGFQKTEVERQTCGEGVTLYDVRPDPDGSALLKSRQVEVSPANMATTPLTLVGNSADLPALFLRLSPATGHAAEILDV